MPTLDPAATSTPIPTDPLQLTIPIGKPSVDGAVTASQTLGDITAFSFVKRRRTTTNLDGYDIPLGSVPAFACLEGLTIDQIESGLNGELYTEEQLAEIFDEPSQMILPLDFDAIDWASLPGQRLELRMVALLTFVVGNVYITQTTDANGALGYVVEMEPFDTIITDVNASAIHFAKQPSEIRMAEPQNLLFNDDDVVMFNSFIPAEKLTGMMLLYVTMPCVFLVEEQATFEQTEEEIESELALLGQIVAD